MMSTLSRSILAGGLLVVAAALPARAQDDAAAAWTRIHEVFSHPRCANCHVPADNRPRWSGANYGTRPRVHGMNVNGDESRIGARTMMCGTCHAKTNSPVPHGPPGAEVWALAPLSMQWWDRTSAQICEQIKDSKRNGGRTLEQVIEHVDHDKLVSWGWSPGPGREPAPRTKDALVADLRVWVKRGAPCPKP